MNCQKIPQNITNTITKKPFGRVKLIHGAFNHNEQTFFAFSHIKKDRCLHNQKIFNILLRSNYTNVVRVFGYCACVFVTEPLTQRILDSKPHIDKNVRLRQATDLTRGIVSLNKLNLSFCEWERNEFLYSTDGALKINDLDHVIIHNDKCGCTRGMYYTMERQQRIASILRNTFNSMDCMYILRNYNVTNNIFQVFGILSILEFIFNAHELKTYTRRILDYPLHMQTTLQFLNLLSDRNFHPGDDRVY